MLQISATETISENKKSLHSNSFINQVDEQNRFEKDRFETVKRIVTNPLNTCYFEMTSDAMEYIGIKEESILIVDKSIVPEGGNIVVFWYQDQWMIRQVLQYGNVLKLSTGKEKDEPIQITSENKIQIFGVVTWCCNKLLEVSNHLHPF